MDTLIERFVENLKNRMALYKEDPDGNLFNDSASTDADGESPNQVFFYIKISSSSLN